jgi:hypothetical protein
VTDWPLKKVVSVQQSEDELNICTYKKFAVSLLPCKVLEKV